MKLRRLAFALLPLAATAAFVEYTVCADSRYDCAGPSCQTVELPEGGEVEGVELTRRALLAAFEKHKIETVTPELGDKFDPKLHQAMFEVPNPDVPNNTVVQVVQAGYQIGDRVLRPAMVGVAKGGPKQTVEAEPGAPNPEAEKDA